MFIQAIFVCFVVLFSLCHGFPGIYGGPSLPSDRQALHDAVDDFLRKQVFVPDIEEPGRQRQLVGKRDTRRQFKGCMEQGGGING